MSKYSTKSQASRVKESEFRNLQAVSVFIFCDKAFNFIIWEGTVVEFSLNQHLKVFILPALTTLQYISRQQLSICDDECCNSNKVRLSQRRISSGGNMQMSPVFISLSLLFTMLLPFIWFFFSGFLVKCFLLLMYSLLLALLYFISLLFVYTLSKGCDWEHIKKPSLDYQHDLKREQEREWEGKRLNRT